MYLISWNVNGIRAAVKNGFVNFLKQEQPNILGLQEIKIDSATRAKTEFDFTGYDEYWNPAKRPGLEFDQFYFLNCYFPNANHELSRLDFKEEFNAVFLKYVKKLETKKPIVVCGDFNVAHQEIDLARPTENSGNAGFTVEERKWADKFLEAGLVDTFRLLHPEKIQYSWWSYRNYARDRNIGWRIDYFMVSKILGPKIKKAFILDEVIGSDHAPVGIEIEI